MAKVTDADKKEAQKALENVLKNVKDISQDFYRLWGLLYQRSLDLNDVVAKFKAITPPEKQLELKAAVTDYGDFKAEWTAMKEFNFQYKDASMVVGKMKKGEDGKLVFSPICSPLRIRGLTEDAKTRGTGTLISIRDRFGGWRDVVLSQAELFGDGEKWVKKLTDAGLKIVSNVTDIRRLLHCVDSQKRIRTVDQIGWLEGEDPIFVFPDRKANGSNIVFSGDGASYYHAAKGSAEDWKKEVSSYGEENSRLGFAICAALAAPLLKPLGIESGGFHLVGPSSRGKTTALQVGASVWGEGTEKKDGYIKSWRSTDNAMEGVAYRHNDVFLAIDEVGQADKTLGATVYMLANGGGKDRMKASTEARPTLTWRTMFMSTGEATIADKIESEGKKSTGGQAVRVVDVPADAGKGHFLFDTLPPGVSGKELTTKLKADACKYYGTAGPAFVEFVSAKYTHIADSGRDVVELLAASFVPPGSDGQVERVATRFALLAYAGEQAIAAGILPWKSQAAAKIAHRCFNDWLAMRGTNKALEPKKGVDAVLKFITAHGKSRFQEHSADNRTSYSGAAVEADKLVINRVGFKVTKTVYLLPVIHDGAWRVTEYDSPRQDARRADVTEYWVDNQCWSEVCGGNAPVQTARDLRDAGLLKTREGRNITCTKTFPGLGNQPYYVVVLREGPTALELEHALWFAPTETRRRREAEARLARERPDVSPEMIAYRKWISELEQVILTKRQKTLGFEGSR